MLSINVIIVINFNNSLFKFAYVNLCVLFTASVMKSINSIARTNKLIARCNTQKVRCACASDLPPAVLGRAPTPHFDPRYIYANFVLLWKHLGRCISVTGKTLEIQADLSSVNAPIPGTVKIENAIKSVWAVMLKQTNSQPCETIISLTKQLLKSFFNSLVISFTW